MKTRRKYDRGFKEMIVSLLNSGQSVKSVSEEYGLNDSMIRRWKKEFNNSDRPAFTGNGNIRLTEEEKQIAELKKQLREVTIERDILKKAVSIFSASDRKNMSS